MFDMVVENSGGTVTIRLKGDVTIQHALELKTILLRNLKKSDHFVVNINDVEKVDFSCLQLFCSLHKESIKNQTSFKLFYEENQSFGNLALHAGYFKHTGCRLDTKKQGLWLGGINE